MIGCPGSGDNYLPGVATDLKMAKEFLQSPNGGSWNSDEIIVLANTNWQTLAFYTASCKADYAMVYFSGHGFTDITSGKRMIKLEDHSIPDLRLLTSSKRQLVLIDACRNFSQASLSGIPDFQVSVDHFEGVSTRDQFDRMIINSPEGCMIAHATQSGRYSYDTAHGGVFTNTLLQLANRIQSGKELSYCTIDVMLQLMQSELKAIGSDQTPVVTYRTGNLHMPFAFGIPGHVAHDKQLLIKKKEGVSMDAVLSLGLTALVITLLIAASSE